MINNTGIAICLVSEMMFPSQDTYLYTLKTFAEVYGPGKATKMGPLALAKMLGTLWQTNRCELEHGHF